MTSFGSLLKHYREKKQLTKVAIAKAIGKTDTYIRKLENNGYTPPTFGICQKIAEALNLTKKQKKTFFQHAFLERIKSESAYYDYLKSGTLKKKDFPTISSQWHAKDGNAYKCTYQISWKTYGNKKLITKDIEIELESILKEVSLEHNYQTLNLLILENAVQLLVDCDYETNILDFVTALKALSEDMLQSKYNALKKIKPSLWDTHFTVETAG